MTGWLEHDTCSAIAGSTFLNRDTAPGTKHETADDDSRAKGTPRVPVGGSATRDLTTHAKCRLLGQPRRILPDPRTARCAY